MGNSLLIQGSFPALRLPEIPLASRMDLIRFAGEPCNPKIYNHAPGVIFARSMVGFTLDKSAWFLFSILCLSIDQVLMEETRWRAASPTING